MKRLELHEQDDVCEQETMIFKKNEFEFDRKKNVLKN